MSISAQEIVFPPNAPLCVFDVNGNGDASEDGEVATCSTGQVYNPITDLPGPDTALTCPLARQACERPIINTCQIDSTPCDNEFSTTCSRPLACQPVVWDEDGGTGAIILEPAIPDRWFCPSNGNYYESEAEAIASCRLLGPTYDPYDVEYIDLVPGVWACFRDFSTHPTQELAIQACTYIGDIGPAPTEFVIGSPPRWYCSENDTYYATEAEALTGCLIVNQVNGFDCPSTPFNDRFLDASACQLACEQTGTCVVEELEFECPIGDFPCVNETDGGEDYFCSANACGTYEDEGEYEPVEDSFTPNDGQITEDGCLDNIQIFNGKAESCRLAGAASAFQNCCNQADEDLLTDSQGSVSESIAWAAGISALSDAGAAAYSAYTAATTGGASIGGAAGSSVSAFQSTLLESLGSTTMVVSVGVIAVTAYLENACPPEGVVTAIKKAANQCVLIGTKCTTRILGSCVQRAEVHCCFNSMMATLIQEGGREQLGMDFGTVEAPNCRGFTPEEFQSIDFSKIDLTEYYAELETRAQSDIEDEITTTITNAAGDI